MDHVQREPCPCKHIKCPRHGDCTACREHHHISVRKPLTRCEKPERKKQRKAKIALMKKLWRGEKAVCPKCGKDTLIHLHKKAKKSDCDWKCPSCSEIYWTIAMLKRLPID